MLPVLLAVIAAIAIGMRAVNKSRVEGAQPIADNPLRETGAISSRSRTVAVLPFDNISADAADAYLAQGFPEMILNRLSRIEGLSVIARNSSFALPTNNIDSSEIGRRLNSGYLVGGSVQREADRLRVAVHLVDSAAGTLVWSAHFDRDLHDIFSIEDEIADQIADALSVRIGERTHPTPWPVPAVQIWRLISPSCRVVPCWDASPSPSRKPRRRISRRRLRWIPLSRPPTPHCTTRGCKQPINAARI